MYIYIYSIPVCQLGTKMLFTVAQTSALHILLSDLTEIRRFPSFHIISTGSNNRL